VGDADAEADAEAVGRTPARSLIVVSGTRSSSYGGSFPAGRRRSCGAGGEAARCSRGATAVITAGTPSSLRADLQSGHRTRASGSAKTMIVLPLVRLA
jgi:hypothetical protein